MTLHGGRKLPRLRESGQLVHSSFVRPVLPMVAASGMLVPPAGVPRQERSTTKEFGDWQTAVLAGDVFARLVSRRRHVGLVRGRVVVGTRFGFHNAPLRAGPSCDGRVAKSATNADADVLGCRAASFPLGLEVYQRPVCDPRATLQLTPASGVQRVMRRLCPHREKPRR
jgi:hypothetical protein